MAKLWKFLAISIVAAVCLGLLLVPVAVPGQGQVALASGNVTVAIEPATTQVSPNGSFTIEAVINNPDGMPIQGFGIRLDFDPTYFTVESATGVDLPEDMGPAVIDNVTGTIQYDPKTALGTNTTATHIIGARINCTAKALEGVSTVDYVYIMGPPPRYTKVIYGVTDYLESGNMSLMHSGTVIVGDVFNLTVTSDGCCPITVGTLGTVAANSNGTFMVPCPNVTLTANDTASACNFTNWTVDGGAPTTNKSVIVSGIANSSHTAVARCAAVAGATLEGHVTFPGAPEGPRCVRGLEVMFFNSTTGNETAWSPMNATTNSTGVFNITVLDPGTYDIGIKNWTCLSEVNTSVTLGAGNTTVVDFGTTREGDSNNDDIITGADRSLLYSGWGKSQGEGGYNVHYDFNRDDSLTGADRSLMYASWAQGGDLP